MMPTLATAKLIGYGLAALALIALVATVLGWRSERNALRARVAATCAVTKAAADNPRLSCKAVDAQIRELGRSIANLKGALARQNAAVTALSDASAKAQDEAVKAISASKERVKAAQGQSDRSAASARDPARGKAPCEPSAELKGAWR
jgi:hypothetical protein